MEEDIKILEELKEDETLDCSGIYKRLSEREQQAIQNIIAAYKDQKCKADIQDATIKNMQDFMEQLEKENKELQKENIELDKLLSGAGENSDMLENELADSIPKSVIREKIDKRQFELQQEHKDFKDDIRLNTLQEIYYGGSNE